MSRAGARVQLLLLVSPEVQGGKKVMQIVVFDFANAIKRSKMIIVFVHLLAGGVAHEFLS